MSAEQQLIDFSFRWEGSFPGVDLPDFLNVLKDPGGGEDEVSVALEVERKSLGIQEEMLQKQLDQVRFCLTWIREATVTKIEDICEENGLEAGAGDYRQPSGNDHNNGASLADRSKISDKKRLESSSRTRSSSLAGEGVGALKSWQQQRRSIDNGCKHRTKDDVSRMMDSRAKNQYVNVGALMSKSLNDVRRGLTSQQLSRPATFPQSDQDATSVRISKIPDSKPVPLTKRPSDLFLNLIRQLANSESDCPSPGDCPSPLTPSGDAFFYGIEIIRDYRPSSGLSEPALDEFRRFILVRGQRMDVIGLYDGGVAGEQYVARNTETEMGLVPKDKCDVNHDATPIIWQKEWFVTSSSVKRYSELTAQAQTGTFYIRNCSHKNGDLCLVVKTGKSMTKFQIKVDKSYYSITPRSSGPRSFLSLDELITFYKTHSLTVEDQTNICLTIPCKRMDAVSN